MGLSIQAAIPARYITKRCQVEASTPAPSPTNTDSPLESRERADETMLASLKRLISATVTTTMSAAPCNNTVRLGRMYHIAKPTSGIAAKVAPRDCDQSTTIKMARAIAAIPTTLLPAPLSSHPRSDMKPKVKNAPAKGNGLPTNKLSRPFTPEISVMLRPRICQLGCISRMRQASPTVINTAMLHHSPTFRGDTKTCFRSMAMAMIAAARTGELGAIARKAT